MTAIPILVRLQVGQRTSAQPLPPVLPPQSAPALKARRQCQSGPLEQPQSPAEARQEQRTCWQVRGAARPLGRARKGALQRARAPAELSLSEESKAPASGSEQESFRESS